MLMFSEFLLLKKGSSLKAEGYVIYLHVRVYVRLPMLQVSRREKAREIVSTCKVDMTAVEKVGSRIAHATPKHLNETSRN